MDFDGIRNDVYAIENDGLRARVIADLAALAAELDREERAARWYRTQLALLD